VFAFLGGKKSGGSHEIVIVGPHHELHILLLGRIFVHLGCRFLALDHLLLHLSRSYFW
jgi:hypothetical protein